MSSSLVLPQFISLLAAFEVMRIAIVLGTLVGIGGGGCLLIWLGRLSWRRFKEGRTELSIALAVLTLVTSVGFAVGAFYGIVMSGFALFYHQ